MSDASPVGPEQVLHFWFDELAESDWWRKDDTLDRRIAGRFGATLEAAARCGCSRRRGWSTTFEFERQHKAIIDRLGRYPHRNAALGRASTPEEPAFLREPGSGF
jgi:uncharacterized protein (DUF924 family)